MSKIPDELPPLVRARRLINLPRSESRYEHDMLIGLIIDHLEQQSAPPEAAPERATRDTEAGPAWFCEACKSLNHPSRGYCLNCQSIRPPLSPSAVQGEERTAAVPTFGMSQECVHEVKLYNPYPERRFLRLHGDFPEAELKCEKCGNLVSITLTLLPASPVKSASEEPLWMISGTQPYLAELARLAEVGRASEVVLASSSPTAPAQRGEEGQATCGFCGFIDIGLEVPPCPKTATEKHGWEFPIIADPLPAQTEPGWRCSNCGLTNSDWHAACTDCHTSPPQPPSPAPECAHPATKKFPVVTHWDGRHYRRSADWCRRCGAMIFSDETIAPSLATEGEGP